MNTVTYNIPAHLIPEYNERQVVVHSEDPIEIVSNLSDGKPHIVQYVQIPAAGIEPDDLLPLANWGHSVPLDVLINDPETEFQLLYNFSKLLDKHPIRASIAVKPGFVKAVKLALALHFEVKLVVEQPDSAMIEDLAEVLEMYLHRANVGQPVEYFHSIFLAAFRQEPIDLWIVQEDDPEYFRFIADDGVDTVSARFAGVDPAVGEVEKLSQRSDGSRGTTECDSCEFLQPCGGYFKWPVRDYDCTGVKSIFSTINDAAAELRENVDSMNAAQGVSRS